MNQDNTLVLAFAASVRRALGDITGTEPVVGTEQVASGPDGIADVSALIRLSSGGEGYFALSFPAPVAAAIARRVLAGVADPDDALVRDCMGEVANVVAGQAKTMLVGSPEHFTFSTPALNKNPLAAVPAERWVASCTSEFGEFFLHLRPPQ